ncbi:hypothetical protein ACIRYZ_39505 [Kitasatospora sp. NPDC101155]|uniref:hypothetical protein n=1 Tax=Kitasatospora sp. NPDC101155 TaxID=3364097 RepID=UPI00381C68A2
MSCPLIANADTIRVTRVDGCGRPICGPEGSYVFDCFASLSMKPNIDQGKDVEYKAANGRVCGFKRGCPSFKGFDIELKFVSVSPEFIELTTGNPVVHAFDGVGTAYPRAARSLARIRTVIGGTSAVAPLYAGLFAVIMSEVGFFTPFLHAQNTNGRTTGG